MLKVKLEMFMEQGSKGAYWSVYDETKKGYEGLIDLQNGDYLEIPNIWKGFIQRDTESNKEWYPWCLPFVELEDYRSILTKNDWDTRQMSNKECKAYAKQCFKRQVAGGYICHWIQKDVDADLWATWFLKELDAWYISVS